MARAIDYYFTSISPFSYLGHQAVTEVAAKHGAILRHKPINLGGLWEASGAVPVGKRAPMRQRYRLVELQRAAELRGLPITPKPAHFPVDPTLPDLTITAIVEAGGDPGGYMSAVFKAIWVDDRDISEEAVLAELLEAAGHDAAEVLARAKTDHMAALRVKNTEEAVAADAVGVPAYVLDGEPFWGQDRVEYLDQALATGRKPFTVPGD